MLDKSDLEQLRRFARSSVQSGALNKKGGVWLMEIIDHYEQTIRPEPIPEPETSNEHSRNEVDRGSSGRGGRKHRNR